MQPKGVKQFYPKRFNFSPTVGAIQVIELVLSTGVLEVDNITISDWQCLNKSIKIGHLLSNTMTSSSLYHKLVPNVTKSILITI